MLITKNLLATSEAEILLEAGPRELVSVFKAKCQQVHKSFLQVPALSPNSFGTCLR